MRRIHEGSGNPVRRFVVTVDVLQLRSGYYRSGDVLTGILLGGDLVRLQHLGAVREGDYELEALFDDLDDAPEE